MRQLARGLILLVTLAATSCVDSSVVLYVSPSGRGHAEIKSRVYEAGLRAFDSLFPFNGGKPSPIEEELPPPDETELSRQFGGKVKLASTQLVKTSDGVQRTTVVEFDDLTTLRMAFPPVFATPASGYVGIDGLSEAPVISFAFKRHDNGDRLLVVRLPDDRREPDVDPNAQMTVFKTGSEEERTFRRAVEKMALRLYVELEGTTLLRSNSPAMKGNRATILDVDLEKVVNGLDEDKVRRVMTPGSMQEMLWQLGDMPGAIVPTEHEVFLEFEGPQTQAPAPASAAQAPPDTEIYLAPLKIVNGVIEVGAATNITNNPGYDNQPFFTPDGKGVLFTSVRGGPSTVLGAGPSTQTDIYRYDLDAKRVTQVTSTPESEYSPTVTPSGALSVIRVELDGSSTQRLWRFTIDGRDPKVILENVKPVGYHAWADDHTLALFVLGQPATLQLADTASGTARSLASDIGRSIQPIPGAGPRAISFVQRERTGDSVRLLIKKLDPRTGEITLLTPAVEGGNDADTAWTPDGTLLMVRGGTLFGWRSGQSGWKEVALLERMSLRSVTRLAVSPKGDYIALVGSPR